MDQKNLDLHVSPHQSTSRILGYTRWNDDIIAVESTDDNTNGIPSLTATTNNAPSPSGKPTKIKISLSQNQINGKPPPKPSAIPKRSNLTRPSAALNQSLSLHSNTATSAVHSSSLPYDADLHNDVFAAATPSKPVSKLPSPISHAPRTSITANSTDCRIPAREKVSLLRKFSAPTIDESTVNLLQTLNKRSLGFNESTIKSGDPIAAATALKFNSTSALPGNNKYIEDRYKCTICSNPFSDPRVLDCLHTFCFPCLCNMNAGGLGVAVDGNGISGMLSDATGADDTIEMGGSAGGGGGRLRVNGDGSELDLSVSETGKSSESIFPKSLSNSSSMGTVAESIHERINPRLSVASVRTSDAKSKNRKKSLSKPPRSSRISSTLLYSESPKSIVCPMCGVSTTVPVGGMHRLPSNFVAKRKLKDALLKLGSELHTSVWCTLCFNETLAIACCLICNMNLCTFCKEAHVRQRRTSLHDVRYLNDLRANYQQQCVDVNTNRGAVRVIKCPIHPSHELKLFCTICQQVACTNCTILLHRGHKCEPVLKASKVYVKMVKTELDRTLPLTDYANDAIMKLNSYTKTVARRVDVVQSEVDNFLTQYLAALDAHRRTLHTQIIRARESKMKTVSEHQTDLAKRCADARTSIQFADELLAIGNDTEILTFAGVLLRRFEHCQRSRDSLDPRSTDALTFLPEIRAPFTMDQNNIPMYGIITTQTAIPKFCSINEDGLMQLRVHRKVELTMTSRDAEERPLCHGGLTVDVVLKYRDMSSRPVATKVADRRDGTYVISFVPDSAGAMVMTAIIQGKHIKGSPFNMYARTLRPHPGIFHCCSFCSSKGSRTAVCACKSIMVGGYKGCGHGHDGHPGRRHWSCCGSDLESSECSATNAFR